MGWWLREELLSPSRVVDARDFCHIYPRNTRAGPLNDSLDEPCVQIAAAVVVLDTVG
jgi:hypothetical protein